MQPCILVADDHAEVRRLVERILTARGYEVRTAANGREALDLIEREPVDLAILDVLMPELDGIETVLEIRRRWPRLPLIAMSGGLRLSADLYLRSAHALGAQRMLRKPFTADELCRAVESLTESERDSLGCGT
ncbi:MAG TPA: response regulator [Opitutaceae bacterium]|nr:response regulator [Opitutaceae bacterium]